MRIADSYIQEIIDAGGTTRQGAVSREATCRLALDLREARETIRKLKQEISDLERLPGRKLKTIEEHTVTGRFGNPRGNGYEERIEVHERGGKISGRRA